MRRGARAAALLLVATLALTGCVQWFLPPETSSTSTPTNEDVPAELERFYAQVLTWQPCESSFQCATAIAPLDWAQPTGDTIELALIRQPATSSDRIGSLLVNPGGPGGSGYDFIRDSVDYATDERLQSRFDVVGFDPRGVNRSSPVTCYENPAELDAYLYDLLPGLPGSDEWLAAAEQTNAEFGRRCLELTGPLLGHVDTVSAARDLDMLRAALGDDHLDYLGYSYGTLLGQVYAELFPDRVGRFVLDGAVDPAATDFESTAGQALGFERALTAFLQDCPTADDCPFGADVQESLGQIRALLDTLDLSPIANDDGRQLGSAAMFSAIILPLYNPSNWPYLRQLFTEVFAGDAEYAFQLADNYNGRDPAGTYRDNQTEAFVAINCLDAHETTVDVAALRDQAQQLLSLAPTLGPQLSWGSAACAGWPVPAQRDRAPITADGAPDILVLGTTNDPATPYEWAETVADTLQRGHLVTYRGEGHTAYNKSNDCVNEVVDAFLLDGTVPESDPRC